MRTQIALLVSNTILKVIAICIAFFLWSLLSDLQVIDFTTIVPVSILQNTNNLQIESVPETATVTLRGSRKKIRSLATSQLKINIHENDLAPGIHAYQLNSGQLMLPSGVNLVHYIPINFVIKTSIKKDSAPKET